MRITKITVDNYRVLEKFEINLEDELSLVIGKNNTGKTSLLSILDKFIGGKSSSNAFLWDDFSVSFQKRLRTFVEQEHISADDQKLFPDGISLNLYLEYGIHDNITNISALMMDLDENNNTAVMEFRYSLSFDMFETLKNDYHNHKSKKNSYGSPQSDDQSESTNENLDSNKKNVNLFYDFMKEEYKKYFKIEKNAREYDLANRCAGSLRKSLENDRIINKIICFQSIHARRTVSNSETNSALSHLSSEYYKKIEEKENSIQAIEDFKALITATDDKLNSVYQNVFGSIIEKIKTFGGIRDGDTEVKILSSLQRRELLKGNTTVKYAHDEECHLPENHNGLGYLNLIGMIFEIEIILAELRKDGNTNESPADINLFFIEEPEAHTHPQMQYVFIKNIKEILKRGRNVEGGRAINLQTIISTHSSHIVSESNFDDIKYLYLVKDKYAKAKDLRSLGVEYEQDGAEGIKRFKFLKQYLTLHRSELFFADKAIFIEGDTERILLPSMMEKLDNEYPRDNSLPLLSQHISVIEVGNYSHIFGRLIDFIGIKSLIITDIDPAKPNSATEPRTKAARKKKTVSGEIEDTKLKIGKCNPTEATLTTNASLKHYFSQRLEHCQNPFQVLHELTFDQKHLRKSDSEELLWEPSVPGNITVVYQVEEENSANNTYLAGSFEDAFLHLNRQFVIDNMNIFQSLKNKVDIDDLEKNAWDLAQNCIEKKTSFAIEILLASDDKFSNWAIPKYIKEGLIWLKSNN